MSQLVLDDLYPNEATTMGPAPERQGSGLRTDRLILLVTGTYTLHFTSVPGEHSESPVDTNKGIDCSGLSWYVEACTP